MQSAEKGNHDVKYFIYVRKSSEQKERQALSIPAQLEQLQEQFGHLDIEIIDDEKSAFKPYNRPGFAEMIDRMRRGERTGLIAWHPDRLSRNEIDASTITYGIRTGMISDLLFATYNFENTPEGIWMLQLALSQSQYASAKRVRDIKRGDKKKCRMGWRPGVAPLGYLNYLDPLDNIKKIKKDTEREAIIRKMFDLMLSGNHTPPEILHMATEEWGLRSRRGNKLSKSSVYYLFTREFYFGEFEYPVGSGDWYKGKHKPYISETEFDQIQRILGRKDKPRRRRYSHAFTGIIRCGECGCMITQEHKTKVQQNGNVHHYYFAHCTKRKRNGIKCTQPSIHVDDLERQINQRLEKIRLPIEFHSLVMRCIQKRHNKESDSYLRIIKTRRKKCDNLKAQLRGLTRMRAGGEISADEYRLERREVTKQIKSLQSIISIATLKEEAWLETADNMFRFVEHAVEKFNNGTTQDKREIFTALGSNFILKDKKLSLDWHSCLLPIQFLSKKLKAKKPGFEPLTDAVISKQSGHDLASDSSLLSHLDAIRTALIESNESVNFDFVLRW